MNHYARAHLMSTVPYHNHYYYCIINIVFMPQKKKSLFYNIYGCLGSSVTERRFNNYFMLHVYKELAECINLADAANEFPER